MRTVAAKQDLTAAILSTSLSEDMIQSRVEQIQLELLSRSSYVREPNFTVIHPGDLEILFHAYDQRFFSGHCHKALEGRQLSFRLSPRMTRTGGTTTRSKRRATGEVSFEITIASSMLFDQFFGADGVVSACGLDCSTRLQALQRIFEHELLHLAEYLCWDASDCSGRRFQDAAQRLFLHRAHTHSLVTRREQAARSGIRVGSRVGFVFEGRPLSGRVNRITKRATVLVPDPGGQKFSDGHRYKTYYVPLAELKLFGEGL